MKSSIISISSFAMTTTIALLVMTTTQTKAQGVQVNPNNDGLGVNVPLFFDMARTRDNLDISVLSGLVNVRRNRDPISGRSRTSEVSVFGIPVFGRALNPVATPNPNDIDVNAPLVTSDGKTIVTGP